MKLAFISDIHSNLPALLAVLADISHHRVDMIFCMGDIIGYGARPRRCLKLIRKLTSIIIRGNHEEAIIDPNYAAKELNDTAIAGVDFTRKCLRVKDINFLETLPLNYVLGDYDIALAHGAFVGCLLKLIFLIQILNTLNMD